jgi:hypothetical protein
MAQATRRHARRKQQHSLILKVGPLHKPTKPSNVAVTSFQCEEDVSGQVGSEAFRVAIIAHNLKKPGWSVQVQ